MLWRVDAHQLARGPQQISKTAQDAKKRFVLRQTAFSLGTRDGGLRLDSAVEEQGEPSYPRKWNHEFIDLPVVEKGQPEQATVFRLR